MRTIHRLPNGLVEFPPATVKVVGQVVPVLGGGYFRLFPYALSRWALRHVNRKEQQSGVFYFHPWEIDPEQPRVNGVNARTRFRHYVNLHRTAERVRLLLRDFHWDRVDRVVFGAQ